jgi:hypothetical protein
VPNAAPRSFGSNSIERRHIRRIVAQTKDRANYPACSPSEL